MATYLRVWTVEVGMELKVLWEGVPARVYFKNRKGREVRIKAGGELLVAYQGWLQHVEDPLGKHTLEQVCRIHLSGAFVTYTVDMRSNTPIGMVFFANRGALSNTPPQTVLL